MDILACAVLNNIAEKRNQPDLDDDFSDNQPNSAHNGPVTEPVETLLSVITLHDSCAFFPWFLKVQYVELAAKALRASYLYFKNKHFLF